MPDRWENTEESVALEPQITITATVVITGASRFLKETWIDDITETILDGWGFPIGVKVKGCITKKETTDAQDR